MDLGRNFSLSILLAYYYITDIQHQCSSPHILSVNDSEPVGHPMIRCPVLGLQLLIWPRVTIYSGSVTSSLVWLVLRERGETSQICDSLFIKCRSSNDAGKMISRRWRNVSFYSVASCTRVF